MHHCHTWLLFDWIQFFYSLARYSHRELITVDTSSASTYKFWPPRNSRAKEVKRYVNIIHSVTVLPSVVLSFIHFIYICIHTQLMYLFWSYSFKVGKKALQATIGDPLQSHCGGVGGILPCGGHTWYWRVPLWYIISMPPCNTDPHVIKYLEPGKLDLHVINLFASSTWSSCNFKFMC